MVPHPAHAVIMPGLLSMSVSAFSMTGDDIQQTPVVGSRCAPCILNFTGCCHCLVHMKRSVGQAAISTKSGSSIALSVRSWFHMHHLSSRPSRLDLLSDFTSASADILPSLLPTESQYSQLFTQQTGSDAAKFHCPITITSSSISTASQ